MTLKGSLMVAVAAIALGSASAATPAAAWQRYGGGYGHGPGYGGHYGHPYYGHGGYGHGGYGYGGGWGWGPALGLGIVAGALAGGAYYNSCYRSQPVYDEYGNYMGQRQINVCY